MIAITEIAYLFLFMPLYREFGWSAYKKIGADRQLKRVYKWYQVSHDSSVQPGHSAQRQYHRSSSASSSLVRDLAFQP